MKVRHGFVSNSSSSSFLLDTTATTSEIALHILTHMIKDYESWSLEESPRDDERSDIYQAAVEFCKINSTFDENIMIPWTCNYETWIHVCEEGHTLVDTCNNQNFNLDIFNIVGYGDGELDFEETEADCESADKEFFVLGEHCRKTRKDWEDDYYKQLNLR